ncbi:hypothetical protein ACTXT7_015124 [Hymenolepis weldensis]
MARFQFIVFKHKFNLVNSFIFEQFGCSSTNNVSAITQLSLLTDVSTCLSQSGLSSLSNPLSSY